MFRLSGTMMLSLMTRFERREEQNQVAFVGWFRVEYPRYRNLITLPSFGENIGRFRMRRLKQMGLTPGWPDIFIAVPNELETIKYFPGGKASVIKYYVHGLFIEMKSENGVLTQEQKEMHRQLMLMNYKVHVCRTIEAAKTITSSYLSNLS